MIFKDRFIIFSFSAALAILLIALSVSFYRLSGLSENISLILRFNSGRGISAFGALFDVILFLFSGFFLIALNFLVARLLFRRLRFLSYFSGFLSVFLALLILIQVGVILSVN